MAESSRRRTGQSPADEVRSPAETPPVVKAVRPAVSPPGETGRAADSVPVPIGPFTVLPFQFGRYEIRQGLGQGQMGAVYLAKDVELDRLVALKVARVVASGSAKILKRMEIEAKSAAKIDHPLICQVYDTGEIDGIRFIALQYIDGEDLKHYLKRVGRKRPADEAVRFVLQMLHGLAAAHAKGVIHRDLKPDNVMLNKKQEPVIMDFGLARSTTPSSNAGLTQGMIVGTAAYMSPEQATGNAEGIDQRCDLYAVGVMLFEMLTGEWPFTGGSIEVIGKKCVQEPPSPISMDSSLSPPLAAVCHKMIARRKEDRYSTCAEIIAALEDAVANRELLVTQNIPPARPANPLSLRDVPIESTPTPPSVKPRKSVDKEQRPSNDGSPGILTRFTGLMKSWTTPPLKRAWLAGAASLLVLLVAMVSSSTFWHGRRFQNADTTVVPGGANQKPRLLIDEQSFVVPHEPAIDLIQKVDLSRDSLTGGWTRQGTSLIGGNYRTIYFPARVPADYQLKIRLKRTAESGGIGIGFVMEGRQAIAGFDYYHKFSGLFVDGKDPRENCTTHDKVVFQNDKSSEIVMTIHPGHVHATVDGKTIIDWHGEASRLQTNSEFPAPHRETPYIRIGQATFQIDSVQMIPLKPPPASPRPHQLDSALDMIPLLDVDRDRVSGDWTLEKSVLHSPSSGQSLFSLPVQVPEEYTLSANVELPADAEGEPSLVVGLIAGKSIGSIVLKNDDCLGLERIDGARWNANETRLAGTFFAKGTPIPLVCTVTKQEVRMELDGRTLIRWKGDFERLTPQPDWVPADARKLFFGTMTLFKLSDITLGPPVDPPTLPEHPPLTVGRPVDLLSLIEPERDALRGTWTKENSTLRVLGEVFDAKLVIPYSVPAEYQLKMTVAREPGGNLDDCLAIKFPNETCAAQVLIDGWKSTFSGIHLDGYLPNSPLNATSRRLQALPPGSTQEIVATVRKTGLKVVVGGKTVIDWKGNPNRYWTSPQWGAPDGQIVLGSFASRFRFEKIEIEPISPSSFPPVSRVADDGNLLTIIDVERDSRKGQWIKNAEGLVSPVLPGARLRIPVEPQPRYVLTATIERRQGNGPVCLGLVADGHPVNVAIDWYQPEAFYDFKKESYHVGLAMLDAKHVPDPSNLTHRSYPFSLLPKGKRTEVRCVVLPDTVIVTCGDLEIVRWHGDPRRLEFVNEYLPSNDSPSDRSQLWLGVYDSEFLIRDLRLVPLSPEESRAIEGQFTSVFPIEPASEFTVRRTTKPEDYPRIINEFFPGFSVSGSTDLGVCLLKENLGRQNVLLTHPVSRTEPSVLTGIVPIPAGKKTKLLLEVSHHPRGDWKLVVNANGQHLLSHDVGANSCPVGRTATQPGWGTFEVDLSKFAGQNVRLDIQSAATAWSYEWAYWVRPKLVSTDDVSRGRSDLDCVATGKWIRGVDSRTKLPDPQKMKFQNGVLELDGVRLVLREIEARNVIMRAKALKVSGQNLSLWVRCGTGGYSCWFNGQQDGGNLFGTGVSNPNAQYRGLTGGNFGRVIPKDHFVDIALAAIEDTVTLYVEGAKAFTSRNAELTSGSIGLGAFRGKSLFKDVEYQILDSVPITSQSNSKASTITPAEALQKVGQRVVVEMEVKSSGGNGNHYLNSEAEYTSPQNFAIFISKDHLSRFDQAGIKDPISYYKGKWIQVTGTVVNERGAPWIKVDDPAQIKIVNHNKLRL